MPTVYSIPWWYQQFLDSNGDPLSGGKVRTKYAGTSDDKTTYSDSTGATPQSNPIILNAKGLPTAGPIFLLSGAYDFYLYNSADVLQDTISGINAQSATTDVNTVDDLRALSAGVTSVVRTLGYAAANDGGGWIFYWNSTSTASDDAGMVIQPDSLPATGRWIGLLPADGMLDLKTYGAACDGTTDDITEIQACDTYCAANNLMILISDNTYFATDPSLSSKVKLLPSCQLRWGNINPTLDVVIDGNDKTRHFNNNATYVPTLNVNEVLPEWFGETEASHAITTAVIAALSAQKHKFITQYRFKDRFNVIKGGTGPSIGSNTLGVFMNNTDPVNDYSEVSIIAGTGGESALNFGDADDENIGQIIYNHGANQLNIKVNAGTTGIKIESDGGVFAPAMGSGASGTDLIINGSDEIIKNTCSKRYKKKIKKYEINSGEIIDKIKLKRFTWKNNNDVTESCRNKDDWGFIAEQIAEILPELATYNRDGYIESLDDRKLLILALVEIQSLRKKIKEIRR